MTQNKKLIEPDTIPFEGGQDTYHEPALLPSGSYSLIQNIRKMHPGFKQRPGYIKKHSTADGTNGVKSMFQFSKGKRTERHFYAQMSDGDVLEATDAPPAVTTGVFGSEVHDGSANQIPASWGVLNDLLIYSNGVDQHQLCAGDTESIQKFVVYDSDIKLPDIPNAGFDYTEQVTGSGTDVAVLDSLGNQSVSVTGTVGGSAYITCSGTAVTGVGTAFLSQLTVGQPITVSGAYHIPTLSTDYVKATSYNTTYYPHIATTPTTTLTGSSGATNAWLAGSQVTNQRFSIDLGATKTIAKVYYENYHSSGADTDKGVQNFTFWGSNTAEDFQATGYDSAAYPPTQTTTYVKATTTTGAYYPYRATDPTQLLTGAAANISWISAATTNQRFHIDLGTALTIKKIYYENWHNSGALTDQGVRNFTLWGSNEATAFAELTYGTDTNWTQLTTSASAFDQHTASDVADPKYITVTNTTAYRYYAFKFADHYGGGSGYMGVRRIELQITPAWVQLTTSPTAFEQHAATNTADPKYITVTNSTAYRYYSFKFADNYTDATSMGVRRIQLSDSEADEQKIVATITSNTAATVTSAFSGKATCSYLTTSNDCVLFCTPVTPNKYTITMTAVNGTTSTALFSYYSTTGWKNITITDNTSASSKTLAQTGTITFTAPTDAAPRYMYETNGFWFKMAFTAALDSEVEISTVTYGSLFTSLQDLWDGALVDAIEAYHYKAAATTYSKTTLTSLTGRVLGGDSGSTGGAIAPIQRRATPTGGSATTKYFIYSSSNVVINSMSHTGDYVYFNSPDPIVAVYIDVGSTPNTTTTTTIDEMEYLASSGSWTSVGTFTDGTNGLRNSGFITFARQSDISPNMFNTSTYNSYWYRFGVGVAAVSATVSIGIQVIPYYDINDYGVGLCNATWEHRGVYVFDKNPNYLVVTPPNAPQYVSSSNSLIFRAGDGRGNKIVCMKPVYNELLIAQEEKGDKGGCLTLLSKGDESSGIVGDTTIVSTYYGVMNSQCMEVIETLEGGHKVFFLSRNGILITDLRQVAFVPNFDKVRNYFDTSDSNCIRTGYESKMYLKYDSVYHVLKIGLTTGSSATNNNVFLVYDLRSMDFSCDTYANNFACECECEAASGSAPVVHLAGGQADGTIYVLNSGADDVSTAVSGSVTIELNNRGKIQRVGEMIVRTKTQTAGNMTVTPYHNGVSQSNTKTLGLTAEITNERTRRHRIPLNFKDENISVNFSHATVGEGWTLLDYGVAVEEYSQQ